MSWFDRTISNGSIISSNLVCEKLTVQYQPKTTWPELLGNSYLEVEQIIKREAPWAQVYTMPVGTPVMLDYRHDRIRIFYDRMGKVVRVPQRG